MPRSASPPRDRKRAYEQSRDRSRSRERDYKRRNVDDDRDRRHSRDERGDRREEYRGHRRDPRDDRDRLNRDSERALDDRRYASSEVDRHRGRDERGRDRDRSGERDRYREREHEREKDGDRRGEEGRRGERPHDASTHHEQHRGPRPAAAQEEEEERQQLGQKPKAEPLSLEEILRKKKQQQEEEAKPRFLSKKEREQLALQRRQEEAGGQRARQEEMLRAQRAAMMEEQRAAERARLAAEASRHQNEREREKELELIRKQYLGGEKQKKKVMKASEKFRFNFDWDAKEDTSRDLNPLYNNLHEAMLLFGRGLRAGIDRKVQKQQSAAFENENLKKLRDAAGISETQEMRDLARAREDRASKYEGADMSVDKHWSEKSLRQMTERDWRIFREDFSIAYRGNNPTLPLRSWEEAQLPDELKQAIEFVGYKEPSPIQRAALPLGLKQLDVIGVAETGSGKTAAFVLPMLAYIMRQPPMNETNEADGPYAVVLAPTRELAQQIEEETVKLAHYTNFRVTSIVGGQSIEEQGSKLRRGCEIVIATPGRLLDCLERHYCVLNQCNYVVLDEADRMIDLGFEPQVQSVLDAMPSSNLKPEDEAAVLEENRVYRTTYMFSATMPPAVERLARKYLRRPIIVTIGSAGKAALNVTQEVVMIKENEKPNRLSQEVEQVGEQKVIVFVNTRKQCDKVYDQLANLGYHCTVLHGSRTQDQREAGIKGFKEGEFNVLIATDVAGRGIDVPDVALVVNYDMPNNIEAYTHRIGRTGRAGRKGRAITFLTGHDSEVFYDLKKLLEDSKAPVPPELARHEAAKMKPGTGGGKRDSVVYAKK